MLFRVLVPVVRSLYLQRRKQDSSGHPLPAVFHTSFLTLSHAPSASAFGMIVISNRYNGLPAPQQIASPAEIVPFSIPKELLLKLLQNPEMAALLKSLAKTL